MSVCSVFYDQLLQGIKMEANILSIPGCFSRLTASVTTEKELEFAQKQQPAFNIMLHQKCRITKLHIYLRFFYLKCYTLVIYLCLPFF